MTNDIGMIKAAYPAGQPHPTAPTEGLESDVKAQSDPGPGQVQEPEKAAKESEPLQDLVSEMNDLVREMHRELQFSVDEDSGDTVVKVIDKQTDEVVRQIPSEELMHLRKRLQEAAGVFFQDTA